MTLVLSIFLWSNVGISQDTIQNSISHSLAVNVKSIIGISDYGYFVSPSSPFAINYQLGFDKWGCRISYGGSFENTSRDSELGEDITSKRNTNNFRLGLNYQVLEKGRFTASLGIDGAVLSNQSVYDYTSWEGYRNYNENANNKIGLGPVGILAFAISDHISVAVESWYYIYKVNYTQKYTNGSPDNIIYTDQTTGWSSELFEPSSVYLTVKF